MASVGVKGGLSDLDTTPWGPGSPQFASYIYKDVFWYRLTDRKILPRNVYHGDFLGH